MVARREAWPIEREYLTLGGDNPPTTMAPDLKSHDDKDQSLQQISRSHRASIVSQLVAISGRNNQVQNSKYRSFVNRLHCLEPRDSKLHRRTINAFRQRQYVALSYTWKASEDEDPSSGDYSVEDWDSKSLIRSGVRNCVLDRVLTYMRHADVGYLWIDMHCIRQHHCEVDFCVRHTNCLEKQDAIQAMDLVYQLSEHPVALLGRKLKNTAELHLLAKILSGILVNYGFKLSASTSVDTARGALVLLSDITRDVWWRRAWPFQENYRGATRMLLMIHHDHFLERQKLRYKVFGKVPGEMCIASVRFSIKATKLCLTLREATWLTSLDEERLESVLRTAGRYTLMLDGSSPMTPRLIADIETREISQPWDRLAITANCCQFPIRLMYSAISRQSLSLSILAMCLLNGEILDNDRTNVTSVTEKTTLKFLDLMMFKDFHAPEDHDRWLTFNKGCRLVDVELTPGGVVTSGHLWKLGRVIDPWIPRRKLPRTRCARGRLSLVQRRRLLRLVHCLRKVGHIWLASRMEGYLATDAMARGAYKSFKEMYLHTMAAELANAIRDRRKLKLGSIWNPTGQTASYHAIFVDDTKCLNRANLLFPEFAFTSARQGDLGSLTHEANDIDRHVSLLVELEQPSGNTHIPHLRIKNWLLGMCFFDGYPRTKVVFPWPQNLLAVKPHKV
ncbi:unnamed protein product [Clonostachys solani]|uniref:Heterokaryon incompatibility domain-containing protein n=1 Tax=Clonostachys solani TaxID=160281 RepID=A0A9P0ENN8_9HYPO|nr:unnamed protein product [Clonostachys solani]